MHKITKSGGRSEIVDPAGQRHRVRTLREIARARLDPLAGGIFPTRLGCFERARNHSVRRPGKLEPLILLCLTGEGWVETGGTQRTLRAGDVAWVDCRKPHGYGSAAHHPWTIAWTHLGGTRLAQWQSYLTQQGRRWIWRAAYLERAQAAFEELWRNVEGGESELRTSIACSSWLVEIAPGAKRSKTRQQDPLDDLARELRQEPSKAVSLANLASKFGYSPGHLLVRFRARWGCPPRQYQIRQRMQRACTLLETTSEKIAAVASQVGYDNPFYFSRLFHRTFGVTPTSFRMRKTKRSG